ncbi:MAG: hypothetical protein AAGB29_14120, partial [Planctomycetota bacterium]
IGDAADLCVIQLVGDDDGGPQVAGRYSRRREAANKRMEFAAKLRKGDAATPAAAEEAPAEPEAAAEESTTTAVAEAPAEETTTDESTEQDKA